MRLLRENLNAVEAQVDVEVVDGRPDHQTADHEHADHGEAHGAVRDELPEPMARSLGTLGRPPSDERKTEAVDPGSEQRQDGRQQCERGYHRNNDHRDCAKGRREKQRVWDNQYAHKRDDHRCPAEEHCAVRRGSRSRDGFQVARPAPELLSEARHHEQRIVYSHGEANHRHPQLYEEDQLAKDVADERDDGHRDHDGDEGQPDGYQRRHHRPEEHQQDEERYGDADTFALHQV